VQKEKESPHTMMLYHYSLYELIQCLMKALPKLLASNPNKACCVSNKLAPSAPTASANYLKMKNSPAGARIVARAAHLHIASNVLADWGH